MCASSARKKASVDHRRRSKRKETPFIARLCERRPCVRSSLSLNTAQTRCLSLRSNNNPAYDRSRLNHPQCVDALLRSIKQHRRHQSRHKSLCRQPLHRKRRDRANRRSNFGPDIEPSGHKLDTALHAAARRNTFYAPDLLLEHNADPFRSNIGGQTPLLMLSIDEVKRGRNRPSLLRKLAFRIRKSAFIASHKLDHAPPKTRIGGHLCHPSAWPP